MEKLKITLDVSKINKAKIVDRQFTRKDGVVVTVKEYQIEAIPVKEHKVIASGPGWVMKKTHFVVEAPTKEERAAKTKNTIVGDGFMFENTDNPQSANMAGMTGTTPAAAVDTIEYPEENINAEDIPF